MQGVSAGAILLDLNRLKFHSLCRTFPSSFVSTVGSFLNRGRDDLVCADNLSSWAFIPCWTIWGRSLWLRKLFWIPFPLPCDVSSLVPSITPVLMPFVEPTLVPCEEPICAPSLVPMTVPNVGPSMVLFNEPVDAPKLIGVPPCGLGGHSGLPLVTIARVDADVESALDSGPVVKLSFAPVILRALVPMLDPSIGPSLTPFGEPIDVPRAVPFAGSSFPLFVSPGDVPSISSSVVPVG